MTVGLTNPLDAFLRAGAVEPGLASADPARRREALHSLEATAAAETAKVDAEVARRAAEKKAAWEAAQTEAQPSAESRLLDDEVDVELFDLDAALAFEREIADGTLPLEDLLAGEVGD